ncbi:tautomerase family protein [Paenibacillus hamazuiensis]|uniref:tautomerase family protein n=1 Tax=Paenibacillus hamazuiensis TaxID=2936508 RepID=UPI00200D6366|nr:tautomerase family protein [Paenibacillus hamazuiensis]
MPLLRFDLIKGRDKESLKKLLDVVHAVIVEVFEVPERDRYQIVHEHPADHMIIEDTGLGFKRSDKLVVLSIVSKARPKDKKQKLYSLLSERLEVECGISPSDLMVSIVENTDSDWSFGLGEAQFLTGKLRGD